MEKANFKSELYSLNSLLSKKEECLFRVPIYQRLYVWGSDQVRNLIHDFVNAYERGEAVYFIGTVLVVRRQDESFELIDGQQRFTTLWLLANAWKGALSPFLTVGKGKEQKPRVYFDIREPVNAYLRELSLGFPAELKEDDKNSLEKIQDALAAMESFASLRDVTLTDDEIMERTRDLATFVYERVQFVLTEVPADVDLNKLFEVINNRGIQLQHHEILKARMMKRLNEKDRVGYSILLDSCADMEDFIERSFCANAEIQQTELSKLFENGQNDKELIAKARNVLQLLKTPESGESETANRRKLDAILSNSPEPEHISEVGRGLDEEVKTDGVRSIISFPMLLQHVLRIWLCDRNRADINRVLDRELMKSFEDHFFNEMPSGEDDVKSFIELLWSVRYLFDKHVVKWISRNESETLIICRLNKSGTSLGRSMEIDASRAASMLQGMLYHSQENTTHYWLTPFLAYLTKNLGERESHFRYLQHLDNNLLGTVEKETLLVRTRRFLENAWHKAESEFEAELVEPRGLQFSHYWFYKLEFILWFQQRENNRDGRLRNFRITARNSVEHVAPQKPDQNDNVDIKTMLHNFGNLALVTRSINSEFSNSSFRVKREKFIERNSDKLDSLKMELIYRNETWSEDLARGHQNEMLDAFRSYYNAVKDFPFP